MRDDVLTYVSPSATVEFSQRKNKTPYWLNTADGIDTIENSIYTAKGVAQDGESFVSQNLGTREITITGQLFKNIATDRENLLRAMNPKEAGKLIIERGNIKRYIPCYIRNTPSFGNGLFPAFKISFLCPSPFWREGSGDDENYADVLKWEDCLEWPNDELELTDAGFYIEKRTDDTVVNVHNSGVVDTGIMIVFRAASAVVNPSVENVTTGEKLSLTYTMKEGDEIRVKTGYGEKAATLIRDGVSTNVFNAIDIESDWLQLHPGDNLITYSANDTSGLSVVIYYDSYYLGV